ncbi:MAG: hypothetical protein H7329_07085, partial [Opitutaceae bacterium]|nr:hypothetical protein [Cytophagales bacterium]
LVLLILSVDIFPFKYINLLNNVVYMFVPNTHVLATRLFDSSQNIALITMVFLILVLILMVLRYYLVPKSKIAYGPTWEGGNILKSPRNQYTSSSFSQLFMTYASPVLGFVKKSPHLEKDDIFPSSHVYDTHIYDSIDKSLVKKIVAKGEHFMQYFAFLQTGKLQHYVIYGFAFMFLLFILTFANLI